MHAYRTSRKFCFSYKNDDFFIAQTRVYLFFNATPSIMKFAAWDAYDKHPKNWCFQLYCRNQTKLLFSDPENYHRATRAGN